MKRQEKAARNRSPGRPSNGRTPARRATDLATVLGLPAALLFVVLGAMADGGSLSALLNPGAALIVLGGTAAAILVSFPLADVRAALRAGAGLLAEPAGGEDVIAELVACDRLARKRGMLALDDRVESASCPFLARGLRLVVDGVEPEILRDVLDHQIVAESERDRRPAQVLAAAGGYAPTVGIVGAVLGLIQVMQNLANPTLLGAGIASAFVATLYGVATANLLFLPAATKLELRVEEEERRKAMIVDGLVAVQMGENPLLLEERLESRLSVDVGARRRAA